MRNKVALVTGAAGGIGAAVVRLLAERGALVAAADRDADRLAELTGKLTAEGLTVAAVPLDVTDSASVEAAVDTAERVLGPIDHLVNNAGVLRLGEVRDLTDEDWRTTFAINAEGVFRVSRTVVHRMIPRRRGAIVTVASNAGLVPRAEMAAYAASKAAATHFTKSLGLEVARYGIRCNVVAPGSTDTPMLSAMWADGDDGRAATVAGSPAAYKVGIPLGKLARPEDVAHAVAFLLSDEAGHITLHDLAVDGGAGLGA